MKMSGISRRGSSRRCHGMESWRYCNENDRNSILGILHFAFQSFCRSSSDHASLSELRNLHCFLQTVAIGTSSTATVAVVTTIVCSDRIFSRASSQNSGEVLIMLFVMLCVINFASCITALKEI